MSTKITQRTKTVLIYQGEDLDALDELRRRAERGDGDAKSTLAVDAGAAMAAAREYDELAVAAKERAIPFVLKPVDRNKWRELTEQCPPRPGNENDAAMGVDEAKFGDVLVPASLVEPTFGSDAERDEVLDSLSFGDFERLYTTAFGLSRAGGADPKDSLVSEVTRRNAETSK